MHACVVYVRMCTLRCTLSVLLLFFLFQTSITGTFTILSSMYLWKTQLGIGEI